MKNLSLIVTSLSTIWFLSANNSPFNKMMMDRQAILIASQNPETPDPFTSVQQPISEPLGSLTELTEDETALAEQLTVVIEGLAALPAADSSGTSSELDSGSESKSA